MSCEIGLFEAPVHGFRKFFYEGGRDWINMLTNMVGWRQQMLKLHLLKRPKTVSKKKFG